MRKSTSSLASTFSLPRPRSLSAMARLKEIDDLRRGERVEDVDLGARKKRRDDFERRIFGGRADEGDVAGFDVGKKSVLLGFVEAMDFVDEDDGALAAVGFVFGGGHDFLDFLDAGEDGAEGDEFRAREAGNHSRERGFAAARRTPQEHRGDLVVFDLLAERFAGAEEFFLADEFVERAGAHALGERLVRRSLRRRVVGSLEKRLTIWPRFFPTKNCAGGRLRRRGLRRLRRR